MNTEVVSSFPWEIAVDATDRRCKTCRWWREPGWYQNDDESIGRCAQAEKSPVIAGTMSTGGRARLLTHKDFGCRLWELAE